MQLEKNISYSMSLNSDEVNLLVVEFQQLFRNRAELAKALPNLKAFADGLAGRLALQDYNPAFVAQKVKEIHDRGLDGLFVAKTETPAQATTAAAPTVTSEIQGEAATKKAKTKLAEVKKA